jgi:hypothetical protein
MRKDVLLCAAALAFVVTPVLAASVSGSGSNMPAYYDGQLFTINFFELPAGGETATLARNKSINVIYMSDAGLPGGKPFVSVLDAIQADGFNPLWLEAQITFTAGNTPYQLTSDTQIDSLENAGVITVTPTDEVYRCAVVGTKSGALRGASPAAAAPAGTGARATWGVLKSLYRR